jgi:hypothetical protein
MVLPQINQLVSIAIASNSPKRYQADFTGADMGIPAIRINVCQ